MAAKHDITALIAGNLDPHLVLPMLDFLEQRKVHKDADVTAAKLHVLQGTRMVDFAKEVAAKLPGGAEPPGHKEKRASLVNEHKTLSAKTAELRKVLESPEDVAKLRQSGLLTAEHLAAAHGVTPAMIDDLYHYARFQFDVGKYSAAGELLAFFRVLAPEHPNTLGALWGKLAAGILTQDWAAALESLARLKEAIEAGKGPLESQPALQLTHRSWLLHWSLFVHFNQGQAAAAAGAASVPVEGLNRYLDLAMSDAYTNAVQTTSPHLLRYLTVAHVLSAHRRHPLKELVRIVEQESGAYSDPATLFLRALYIDYDFDDAQAHLQEAEAVLRNDFFAHHLAAPFVEYARLLIFRAYCKIHQCIDLSKMASKLGMGGSESDMLKAEQWIVNVVRNEQDAKIDSANNQIIFTPTVVPVYQKLLDKARALSTATALLQSGVDKALRAK